MYNLYLTKRDNLKIKKLRSNNDYLKFMYIARLHCPNFDEFLKDVSLHKLVKYAIFEFLEVKTIHDNTHLNRKNELKEFFVNNKISNGPIKEYPIFYQVSRCFNITIVKSRREQRILNGIYIIPNHIDSFLRKYIKEWMKISYIPIKEFNKIYDDYCKEENIIPESKEKLNDAIEEFCIKYNGHFERSKQHKVNGKNMRCKFFKK